MPWCFWTKGGAVRKSPMRCCLTTTRSAAGASSSSNAGWKGSPASVWVGAPAIWCEARGRFEGVGKRGMPRSTRQIGAWIETEFGLVYESCSGLIALLHRLGLEYHKPDVIPRKLDEEKQKAFIESYNKLLNSLTDNEAVVFADAVHP